MPGSSFFQESLDLRNGRFTNLYGVELDKTKHKFILSSSIVPIPLDKHMFLDKSISAGINFGSFFLSDDLIFPRVPYLNLLVNNGQVLQFPSNTRPALTTKKGNLRQFNAFARGNLKIGGKPFSWAGSNENIASEVKVFGMFDLTVVKASLHNQTPKRKLLPNSKFVNCLSGQLLIGVQLINGMATVDIVSKSPLDISKYLYIFRGDETLLKICNKGQKIEEFECGGSVFGKGEDVCSASFMLGKTKDELVRSLRQHLIFPKNGHPKPLLKNYLKSWSVVLETKKSIVFFINDARPMVQNQDGISVFELQKILKEKYDYLWACVGDSGQSSKLKVGDEIFGNMHYKNLSGERPFWDGRNGRAIPVALLAYEY